MSLTLQRLWRPSFPFSKSVCWCGIEPGHAILNVGAFIARLRFSHFTAKYRMAPPRSAFIADPSQKIMSNKRGGSYLLSFCAGTVPEPFRNRSETVYKQKMTGPTSIDIPETRNSLQKLAML